MQLQRISRLCLSELFPLAYPAINIDTVTTLYHISHVYQTKLPVTKIIGTNKDTCQHLQLYICTGYVCIGKCRCIYIHTSIMVRSIRSHTSLHWVTLLIARTNLSFYNTNTFLQLTFFCFWRFINWPLLVNISFQFWKWFERTWPQRNLHLGGLVSIKTIKWIFNYILIKTHNYIMQWIKLLISY